MYHFNPRARVGRDKDAPQVTVTAEISIHAPAWGATNVNLFRSCLSKISIHAPAWGATCCYIQYPIQISDFNPRARVGRDHRAGA